MTSFVKLSLLFSCLLSVVKAEVILYSSKRCPYCIKVQNYLDSIGKSVETKYIDNNQTNREELKNKGGKLQVPCLIIDDYPLYGSDEIIKWMKTHPERLQDES